MAERHAGSLAGAALLAMLACASPGEQSTAADDSSPRSAENGGVTAYVDPVRAAPENYRTLFTAAGVRVLGGRWEAGARDAPHSHATAFWYALTDAQFGIDRGEAPALGRRIAAGDSGVQPPISLHSVSNRGDRVAEVVFFEIEPHASRLSEAPPGSAPLALAVSNRFQLLEARGGYRLLLATLAPEQKDRLHSHPRSLWFALTTARIRITESDRSTIDILMEPGAIRFFDATRGHTAANVGASETRILILEMPTESAPGAL